MGILHDEFEKDQELVDRIFRIAAEDWNRRNSRHEGILLKIEPHVSSLISKAGGVILDKSFPRDPGTPSAFKRVSVLLLMMIIHPFLTARVEDQKGLFNKVISFSDDTWKDFLIEYLFDCLPMMFGVLDAETETGSVPLAEWVDFPTIDFRREFRYFLRWVGGNSDLVKHSLGNPIYDDERLARIALGASLVLEACYGRMLTSS